MRQKLLALLSGVLFAIGLGVSGMTQPQKVVGFLDFAGDWDPSLVMVMVGGIATYLMVFKWVTRRETTLFNVPFQIPTRRDISGRLVVGSALFGIGWGIAGYCPGPALGSIGTGSSDIFVFLGAMVVGMLGFQAFQRWTERTTEPTPAEESATSLALEEAT